MYRADPVGVLLPNLVPVETMFKSLKDDGQVQLLNLSCQIIVQELSMLYLMELTHVNEDDFNM